jgi:hypothetical protein
MSESETLTEIKKLRSDLESALHMKFDETLFSRENDDIPRSVRALGGAVMRLEDNITKFAPQYVRTQIGMAMNGLLCTWRQRA